jgi:hypothetical protein
MQNSSLSTPKKTITNQNRDVKKVPFVELLDKRLQGIVSSGSDIERVYVSYFEVGTLNYGCGTNNNRPCGGLRGYPCSHLIELMNEATVQYGFDEVANFLLPNAEPGKLKTIHDILKHVGRGSGDTAGEIFSRFLNDLEYLELPQDNRPLDTMAWFVE